MGSMLLPTLLLLHLMRACSGQAQIQTTNGQLVMQMNGASLTLSSNCAANASTPSPTSSIVYQSDLNAALARYDAQVT